MVNHDIRSDRPLLVQVRASYVYVNKDVVVAQKYIDSIDSIQIYENEDYDRSLVIKVDKRLHKNHDFTTGEILEFPIPNSVLSKYIKGNRVNIRINYKDGSVDEHLETCSIKRNGILWNTTAIP